MVTNICEIFNSSGVMFRKKNEKQRDNGMVRNKKYMEVWRKCSGLNSILHKAERWSQVREFPIYSVHLPWKTERKFWSPKWMWEVSLVVQWLRIHLAMQETPVWYLAQEDLTCLGATRPVYQNYWACAPEPMRHNSWACVLQLLKSAHLEPMLHNKRGHQKEKPMHHN